MKAPAKLMLCYPCAECGSVYPVDDLCGAQVMDLESDAIVIRRDSEGNWPVEMFRAAAAEIQEIVHGAVLHRQKVDGVVAGHWAGRVIGAVLDALAESSKVETP